MSEFRGPKADLDEELNADFDPETAPEARKPKRRKGPTAAQTLGGVIFGFEQQVWRTAPPQELVEHARPDKPVAAPDGSFFTIVMPDDLAIDDEKETP